MNLGELVATMQETEKLHAELDAWSPSCLRLGGQSFTEHPVHHAAEEFLESWQNKN